ncbi:UDP-N-acetylmuramyl pentapeptide phosphotransferase/UDP-N-acetylglucosamine-1-phosphate transferase [Sphaerochaeta pleomorpha str. Grapes]|uniref:UDP-N-acetylmuramyl pentapeptide phosphotransferase/UDP-N-acetylglucosamine-1-phosphate transferase n=1 Tax=Sphaerochaeta pleomorpha (strain ATCC BAA-1885 / DSM 22778 / Grapes) TaxID=158190 RepID=G8QXE2_SPHPG|nr:phospho-N-acetylmuramoyl-pentapeptide-transferase [Sphaerochaeta pleomorpha]AEV28443.1 UDP-N-acetylmuramyl pentapeptide phosphotransferase/UDP-N-acetylglucosamine-1-phosphate transferase [Sphaerochaeta pleomorpha str. Grapes]
MVIPILAGSIGFVVTFVFSRFLIFGKQVMHVAIKPELEKTQAGKTGTPTVGGLAFCFGTVVAIACLQWKGGDSYSIVLMVTLFLFALIGFFDDITKTRSPVGDGISSRLKVVLQMVCSALVLLCMHFFGLLSGEVFLPVVGITTDWGIFYPVCAFVYIMFFSNAVNISDGLDGLAAGSSLPLVVLVLSIVFLGGLARGISLFLAAFLGSLLAFLWYNVKPAKYFMGDCGSQAIGSVIAVSALLSKVELFVLVSSGIFLVEFATSLIQIVSIRGRGKKVFLIAPLHHVFELKGMAEKTIVGRYCIASWLCTLMAFLLFQFTLR